MLSTYFNIFSSKMFAVLKYLHTSLLIFILVDKKICIACTVLHYQGHLAMIPRCRH